MSRAYKIAGRFAGIDRSCIGAVLTPVAPEIPLFPVNISGNTYSSAQLDDWLSRHVIAGTTGNEDFNITGLNNPTSVSLDARQTLWDTYNLILYNVGYETGIIT